MGVLKRNCHDTPLLIARIIKNSLSVYQMNNTNISNRTILNSPAFPKTPLEWTHLLFSSIYSIQHDIVMSAKPTTAI